LFIDLNAVQAAVLTHTSVLFAHRSKVIAASTLCVCASRRHTPCIMRSSCRQSEENAGRKAIARGVAPERRR
jgi:hypothetical protein